MDPTSLVSALSAGLTLAGTGLGMVKDWIARKNTPAEVNNQRAKDDQAYLDKLNSDLDKGDIDAVRTDVNRPL